MFFGFPLLLALLVLGAIVRGVQKYKARSDRPVTPKIVKPEPTVADVPTDVDRMTAIKQLRSEYRVSLRRAVELVDTARAA